MRMLMLAIGIATVTASPDVVACERPDDIRIPDGKTATEKEMLAADAGYRRFMDDMRSYQACLAADADQRRPHSEDREALRQYENTYVARHNAASEAMVHATEEFNKAIDEYKARQ